MNILKKARIILMGLLAMVVFLWPQNSFSLDTPERLEYDLRWMSIKAGSTVLELGEKNKDNLLAIVRTQSADWLSLFYKVDDHIEVLMEKESNFTPLIYYLNLKEGRHKKERKVTYDRAADKIILNNIEKQEIKEFDLDGELHDPLSALYRLRTYEVEEGKPVHVRIFDNGKNYVLEVKVLRRETIRVPAGTFDTIVIKPVLKSEGIFLRKGDVYIWLTDDDRRIPVKMKSKVPIGSVDAVLTGGLY
jgi:hypothetical protein